MLAAFIDESYGPNWFYMAAAIATGEDHVQDFESALQEVVGDICCDLWIPTVAEIHGYELLQGRGPWQKVPLQERLEVAGRVLGAVRDSGVKFIVRGIDRRAQARRYRQVYDPYPLVLTHLVRAVNRYAEEQGVTVRVTCDEIHHHSRHRAMLDRHRRQGTPGYSNSHLKSIAEQLHFVDSRSSAMIQAADVVAYLKHRIVSRPDASRPERRSRANLWRIIEPQIIQDYCWVP